jgi:hypothetical protein
MTPRDLFRLNPARTDALSKLISSDLWFEEALQTAFAEYANRTVCGPSPTDSYTYAGKIAGAREVLNILRTLAFTVEPPKPVSTGLNYGDLRTTGPAGNTSTGSGSGPDTTQRRPARRAGPVDQG